jgi:TolB protein
MAPKLEITQGENMGETFKVKLTTRIGRERDNDVVILDPKMSRYHAQISMEAGQWTLADLGSSNHTYLNGMAITEPTPLQSGDRINLGETELTLKMPGQSDVQPAPPKADPAPVPIITPSPAPAAPAASPPLTQSQPTPSAPPRLAWIAGGFILLLFLVAAVILYLVLGRTPGDEAATGPETPVISADSDPSQPPLEAPNRPADLSLIYEDDFGDSSSGWDDAFDAYTTKQYGNNRYQIEVTTSNLVAWGLANRDVADFEVEVEAKLEDGASSNGYGLLFRFQDRDNFYRFDISGDGYYLLSKFVKGEWVTLVDWTASPFINQDQTANILKVSAFGPNITVWANGQQLASVTDDSLAHGNFGFFAGTFSEPHVWVSFDTLKLWTPKNQEITLLPTATRPRATVPTDIPAPTPTPVPATATPTTAAAATVEAVEATEEPTVTPTYTATPEPTSEPTATPVPLPEYASRDQTLARGETEVIGRIVFPVFDPARGTYDIYMADASDGGNKVVVQKEASQPALSADGADLAYRSWQPDNRGLFARPLAGGEVWQFNPFFESARPQFSPTDKSLMFHSRVGGEEPAIYRVINGVGEVMRREGFPIQGQSAKWSPDGQQFVYSSCLGGKCGVLRSNIDGAAPVILSDHPSDTNPEISPDGSTVVFMSKRSGNWEIYQVGANGGTITALTSDPANDGLPTWSPDGQKIAFVANRDGEWSVWDMDPDGSNQRRLFALGGSVDGVVQFDISNSRSWTEENIDWIP